MSNGQPGFVMHLTAAMSNSPSNGLPPQYPGYPSQPQMYPGQPQMYPGQPQMYPPQQPMYPGNQPFPAPIQLQPGPNNPTSLLCYGNFSNYLRNAGSFHIKQEVELPKGLVICESEYKYTVVDQAGNKIFYVGEESDLCGRQLCNKRRAFRLTVKEAASGQAVLKMTRGLNCGCCCGLVCPDSLKVSIPSGQSLGSVHEEFNLLFPTFRVKGAAGNKVLKVQGPMCLMSHGKCNGSVVFRVLNSTGSSVGTMRLLTDADDSVISFPCDLDPSIKAVLLGTLFLIDYQYFEQGCLGSWSSESSSDKQNS